METYIDKAEALGVISTLYDGDIEHNKTLDKAHEAIVAMPAADVREVRKGKWEYDHWCEFKCSVCGAFSKSEPYRGRENFCPNCGADMREEKT